MRTARIVLHDVHLLLSNDITAEIFLKLNRALECHAKIARLIVRAEEILGRVDVIHVAPTATIKRFEKSRKLDVLKNLIPIHGIDQVAHRLIGRPRRMLLVRKDHGRRNSDPKLFSQRVVKELVVRAPPEGVIDDDGAVECGILQVRTIKRDVM